MPNSTTHFTAGTICAVVLALVLGYFHVERIILFLGGMFCIIFSEFPDIDQGNSIPRKVLRNFLPGVVIVLALYLFFSWTMWVKPVYQLAIFGAVPVAFLFSYEKFIPAHRKEIHQLPGLIIAVLLMLLVAAFLNLGLRDTGVITLFASTGFVSHIVLDQLM